MRAGKPAILDNSYPAGNGVRPHGVSAVNGKAITYDANGNRLKDVGRSYIWDGSNRLAGVTMNGQLTQFVYGGDGTRVKKGPAPGNSTEKIMRYLADANPDGKPPRAFSLFALTRCQYRNLPADGEHTGSGSQS